MRLNEILESAWHGSPHHFKDFRLSKIGTGEGAQTFGWGLYFTDKKEIAEFYKNTLSNNRKLVPTVDGKYIEDWFTDHDFGLYVADIIEQYARNYKETLQNPKDFLDEIIEYATFKNQRKSIEEAKQLVKEAIKNGIQWVNSGKIYKVDIPKDNKYLLWDKKFSQQPDIVKNAIIKLIKENERRSNQRALDYDDLVFGVESKPESDHKAQTDVESNVKNKTGYELYKHLVNIFHTPKNASTALAKEGVVGIKYLDGASRETGEGGYNYVVFDEKLIKVIGAE